MLNNLLKIDINFIFGLINYYLMFAKDNSFNTKFVKTFFKYLLNNRY